MKKQMEDEKMELSNLELKVMETLWDGECLDENGEIQAIELSKVLLEKYDMTKTTCYTCFGRLLEKGAITRRYPKYTLKPIVSREDVLKPKQQEAIDELFGGSFMNFCRAFLSDKKVSKKELDEMKKIIDSFDED